MIDVPARKPRARKLHGHRSIGSLALIAGLAGSTFTGASAQDRGIDGRAGGSRCALYGPGFADLGDGTCARIIGEEGGGSGHVRVDLGSRASPADARTWSMGTTANAALRTDGLGMLPGAADAQHLRVQGGAYGR